MTNKITIKGNEFLSDLFTKEFYVVNEETNQETEIYVPCAARNEVENFIDKKSLEIEEYRVYLGISYDVESDKYLWNFEALRNDEFVSGSEELTEDEMGKLKSIAQLF